MWGGGEGVARRVAVALDLARPVDNFKSYGRLERNFCCDINKYK